MPPALVNWAGPRGCSPGTALLLLGTIPLQCSPRRSTHISPLVNMKIILHYFLFEMSKSGKPTEVSVQMKELKHKHAYSPLCPPRRRRRHVLSGLAGTGVSALGGGAPMSVMTWWWPCFSRLRIHLPPTFSHSPV